MGLSTDKLLKYLPQKYNKNPGLPGPIITIPGTGNPVQLRTGASNVYQLSDSEGFVLDQLFNDWSAGQEELYIGIPSTNLNLSFFPTTTIQVVDNLGNPVVDNSGNNVFSTILFLGTSSTTVDLYYYFFLNPTASNVNVILPSPSNVFNEKYVVIKNTGNVNFIMYGLTVNPGQSIILNWIPQVTVGSFVINGQWVISAGNYYSFRPGTMGEVNILNSPIAKNPVDIVGSFSLVTNLSVLNTTVVYQQTINPLQTVLFQWNNLTSTWGLAQSNYIYEIIPAGADSLSGNYYLPEGNSWLDDVGISYGTNRVYSEIDSGYKKRISQLVTGTKLTVPGITEIVTIVFNFIPKIFNWYHSDYIQMLSLIPASPSAFKYNSITNTMDNYNIHAEPNYPNFGPITNFYVLVSSSQLTSIDDLNRAVYASFSFFNWWDGKVVSTGAPYGGFFTANPGESGAINSNVLLRLGQLLQQIKAAGTNPIVVVLS